MTSITNNSLIQYCDGGVEYNYLYYMCNSTDGTARLLYMSHLHLPQSMTIYGFSET